MSRIGRQPIPVPPNVEVTIEGTTAKVKGPKGTLTYTFNPKLKVAQEDGSIVVSRSTDEGEQRALHGLVRTLIYNMVKGVSDGYRKTLNIVGVGYRAQMEGANLVLQVGFSHRVVVPTPSDVKISMEGNNRIHIDGIDKQRVGEVAAQIRRIRPPDRYKGKGIRYEQEVVKLKPGKRAATKAV